MEQENKKQQTTEPAIHRGEWLVFGFGAFVMSGLIALMLKLKVPEAPIYPVLLAGGLLMSFGFLRSAKPREITGTDQTEK
jgi:hypothetical protein